MIVRAALATLGVLALATAFHQIGSSPPDVVSPSESLQLAPVIIVTKSEITYKGQLVSSTAPTASPSCGEVMEHLNNALFTYDPKYVALAGTYAPRVLASCNSDGWPDDLKRCIVLMSGRGLLDHACDKHVSDELARRILARVAPGQDLHPADFLQR